MKRVGLAGFFVLLASILPRGRGASDLPVEWAGAGSYRLLVRVDPVEIGGRATDEMPAELPIDLKAELAKLGAGGAGRPDIASIQVMRYDPKSGRPLPYGNYAYSRHEADRPFCWYDAAIPYDFPEFDDTVYRTDGRIVRTPTVRGGYVFGAIGDGDRGRLAWTHTQTGREPSCYAVYFSLLAPGQTARSAPPRGWIGDGMPRFDRPGGSSSGADHCRVDLDDWDGDGLIDFVAGESYGHIFWWPNHGTPGAPEFSSWRFLLDAGGLPIDAGSAAAPKIVDWDGDGTKDLLVGAEWNRILYYRNVGSNRDRKLAYQGLVRADGQTLTLPVVPVAQESAAIFKLDYYPVLEAVDWDGDGDTDLLAGGYITGRIYYYENTGRGDDGQPLLSLRGPLEDEKGPINVGDWCAAPCAADLDGDGDLDILSGNMPSGAARLLRQREEDRFLRYYENTGTKHRPALRARAFPKDGTFPREELATPRAADWDGDGDLDLVVSTQANLYLYKNAGTRTSPRFEAHADPLPAPWGNAPLAVDQFRDWDGDGKIDLVSGYTVHLNSGRGNPWSWDKTEPVLPPGESIDHPSGLGDDWFWPYLDDFDGDGRIDVLFGDWHGHVWFHRNLSTPGRRHFDTAGSRLRLERGTEIKVGPVGKDIDRDFDALQGARTVFTAADFDHDGRRDLVVGDTYGIVRLFRNVGTPAAPLFAEPVTIGDLGIRLLVTATDWNHDGWMDVIGGAANGRVQLFLNSAGNAGRPFAAGLALHLPPIVQPRVLVADLNGDGDDDLFLPGTQGSCLIERSFLAHDYARALKLAVEKRGRTTDRRPARDDAALTLRAGLDLIPSTRATSRVYRPGSRKRCGDRSAWYDSSMPTRSILISGIGIGGPTLAYWLRRYGFSPTLVEVAPTLRTGGYVIDFWGLGYDIAERMGLLSEINRAGYHVRELRMVDDRGKRVSGFGTGVVTELTGGRFVSIARSDLSRLLFSKIEGSVEIMFGDQIVGIHDEADGVQVNFANSRERRFDLVIGADGLHSTVRKLVFGPEDCFEKRLGYTVAAFAVSGYRPRDEDVYVIYDLRGRQVDRFAMRDDRTLVLFIFADNDDPPSDPHDIAAQKEIIRERFTDGGWECAKILSELDRAPDLYFDRVSQIRMDCWSREHVALIGDAAFCVSLLGGQGAGLAMTSAYVLAGELARAQGRHDEAFRSYERLLRPYLATKQRGAERLARSFVPKTWWRLFMRNQVLKAFRIPIVARLASRDIIDHLKLPDYGIIA